MTQHCQSSLRHDTTGCGCTTAAGESQADTNVLRVRPATDFMESHENVTLFIELPGVPESQLEIATENGVLEVSGDEVRSLPEGFRPLGVASVKRRFQRQFKLADTLDPSQIQATFKDGLLTLVISKKAENRRQRIPIGASA